MLYKSLNNIYIASFQEAMITSLAPNKELYIPERIPEISKDLINNIDKYSDIEIAYQILKKYMSNYINDKYILNTILNNTLYFEFPLKKIQNNIYTLELFHGPTMSFKDLGVKFMAELLEYDLKNADKQIHVLVATSGDTGGAVANGFYNKKNIKVIILYPKNKISKIQEQQITALGKNIQAISIIGNFDDCQKIVKQTFIDEDITNKLHITTANSINIARLLPQILYYFFIYKQLKQLNIINNKKIIISVPSGNFGNICAGVISKKMGLPIEYFIAATNINDTIPRFIKNEQYEPQPTIPTISNAMDISNPSNFPRILYLFNNKINILKKNFFSYSFNDQETIKEIKNVYYKYNYILDPHGAIGLLGLKKHQNICSNKNEYINVFLETAHPIKFINSIPKTIKKNIVYPKQINKIITKKKHYIELSNKYHEFKNWLLNQ
jgi:threonine synthase